MYKKLIKKRLASSASEFSTACARARTKYYFLSGISLSSQSDPFFSLISKDPQFKRNLKILKEIKCLRATPFTGVEFFIKKYLRNKAKLQSITFEVSQESRQKISTSYLFDLFLRLILIRGPAKQIRKLTLSYSEDYFMSNIHYRVCDAIKAHRNLERFQFNISPLMEPYLAELKIMKKFFVNFARLKELKSLSFELFLLRDSTICKVLGPYLKKIPSLENFQINGVLDDHNNNNSGAIMTILPYLTEVKNLACLSLNSFNYLSDEFHNPVLISMNKTLISLTGLKSLEIKIHFYVNKNLVIEFWSFLAKLSSLETFNASLLLQIITNGCIKALATNLERLEKIKHFSFVIFGQDGPSSLKEQGFKDLAATLRKKKFLKYLKIDCPSQLSGSFDSFFEELHLVPLNTFKFKTSFQKKSEMESLCKFIPKQNSLKSLKLVINPNGSIPQSILNQLKTIISTMKSLENICIIIGEAKKRDDLASTLLESLTNLRKMQLKGIFIDGTEWKKVIQVIKNTRIEKIIIMGIFDDNVDVDDITLINKQKKFEYVRITAIREEKFPFTYEMNDSGLWLTK